MNHEPEDLLKKLRPMYEDVCRGFFEATKKEIFTFCRIMVQSLEEAEEIAMYSLTVSVKNLMQFDRVSEFRAFAYECARKRVWQNWEHATAAKRDVRRTTSASAHDSDDEPLEHRIPDIGPNPAEAAASRDVQAVLTESLLELDSGCATLIEAHVLQEKTLEECAKEREVAVSTLGDWKQKCLQKLRKLVNFRLKETRR